MAHVSLYGRMGPYAPIGPVGHYVPIRACGPMGPYGLMGPMGPWALQRTSAPRANFFGPGPAQSPPPKTDLQWCTSVETHGVCVFHLGSVRFVYISSGS